MAYPRVVRHDARAANVHHGRVQRICILVDRHVERPLHGRPLALAQVPRFEQRPVVRPEAVKGRAHALQVPCKDRKADLFAVDRDRLAPDIEPVHRDGVVVAPHDEQAVRPLVEGDLADGVCVRVVAAGGDRRPAQPLVVLHRAPAVERRVEPD